ncbi:MAG: HYR domain-containing protein [Flavobacteriales bacterium]|nr:HYR domain-containing protein [Flavobacteriales bacterium]
MQEILTTNKPSNAGHTLLKRGVKTLHRAALLLALATGMATTAEAQNGYTTPADVNGNGIYDFQEVTVLTISCPATITVNNDAGSCGAAVTVNQPSALGFCSSYIIQNDFNNTDNASGTYPVGTTTVNWIAVDERSDTARCSMVVKVTDNQAPVIAGCPANISLSADASCNAVATWTAPTVSDNCSGSSIAQTAGLASGAAFPLGTTTVTYTATDAASNTATCSFTVTVTDATAPVIAGCPANISLSAGASCNAVATWTAPTVSDNCSGSSIAQTAGLASGAAFPLGTTTVTYTATDAASNTATCSFTVTVTDATAPVIAGCPANISLSAGGSCTAVATWTAPTVSDNCSGSSIAQTAGLASGAAFPLGTTTVTYTATDAASNTATCSFTVTVTDATAPVIAGCPANISLSAGGSCTAVATWTAPTVSDNCSGSSIAQTAGLASGAAFPLGTTTVTYTATDAASNTATCSFTVTVTDATAPVIAGCPANISLSAGASCNAVATWTSPNVSDNCSGSSIAQTAGLASGAAFPLGTTTVTYTATDAASNTATCSFTVTVTDATAPVIAGCPANISLSAGGSCTAVATWTAPTVSDNCSGSSIAQTAGLASGAAFPLGTTTVTYSATDAASNTATCSFTVTVTDATAPVIAGCPANISLSAGGSCTAVATWTAPTVSDNCSGSSIAQTAGLASGAAFGEPTP